MNPQIRPIAVDLFAGAGGMTLGFEQAGFDVLAAVEIDPIHCATHEYNFPKWKVLCRSVVEVTGKEIRTQSEIGSREIDVLFGGPPCQGFSLMGKRALDDPRNSLVFHFIRIVTELQPKYFVMENVRGLTIGPHKQLLEEIIDKFHHCGYQVLTPYQVLNSAYYGVPQNRERLFLIGCREGLSLPNYPTPITNPPGCKKLRNLSDLPATPTVLEAIRDLPRVEQYAELLDRDWISYKYPPASAYGIQMQALSAPSHNYAYPREGDRSILTGNHRTQHTQRAIDRFKATPPGKSEPISRFHKLNPQGLCNTLRAGTPSNRGAYTSPRPIHPFEPRCITVREAARLHSYPDWFRFHVTKWHGFRQIGNSVPPLLAEAVATEIIRVLGIAPISPSVPRLLGNPELLELPMSAAAAQYQVDPHTIEPRSRRPLNPKASVP
ncbi:DNA cytosine methyltransferase [Laspinema olomoucense]|uniref:Cytosine-specific methyltransferase n=1 Tax=Laspinema olomoucense D3b TaxID=2953688 RepID=A0ABT2N5B7_9CYAN|nr:MULTISPECIES: DNA cytosine methyltransferase [unclassified Laspinema]MCT7972409.1 DNA cytosine methyltransferase [Laspinema sp. D3d]MCT7977884.1 DNA cytosine methyltransferase [Laspinema sp. D3b]MCT7986951.1 DNA cytosine methyltransferase [Laspinema sp. D3a]